MYHSNVTLDSIRLSDSFERPTRLSTRKGRVDRQTISITLNVICTDIYIFLRFRKKREDLTTQPPTGYTNTLTFNLSSYLDSDMVKIRREKLGPI